MKQAIKELIELVKGKTVGEAYVLVDQHLNSFWSLESDEWNKSMTTEERIALINKLLSYK